MPHIHLHSQSMDTGIDWATFGRCQMWFICNNQWETCKKQGLTKQMVYGQWASNDNLASTAHYIHLQGPSKGTGIDWSMFESCQMCGLYGPINDKHVKNKCLPNEMAMANELPRATLHRWRHIFIRKATPCLLEHNKQHLNCQMLFISINQR
jgi:hypothetical protein